MPETGALYCNVWSTVEFVSWVVLRTVNNRLLYGGLTYVSPTEWKKPRESRQVTRRCGMGKCEANLFKVGNSLASGWFRKIHHLGGLANNGHRVALYPEKIVCRVRLHRVLLLSHSFTSHLRTSILCFPCIFSHWSWKLGRQEIK